MGLNACNFGWAEWTLLAVLFTSVQMLLLSAVLVAWRFFSPLTEQGEGR
ncbi:hypothetical protein [Caenibius sp. WL]|nr:hypothetical protein [Caenibius sp. WL]QZP06775.1 hypothetical protein K5X80_08545 [Caenibius sp. WL]